MLRAKMVASLSPAKEVAVRAAPGSSPHDYRAPLDAAAIFERCSHRSDGTAVARRLIHIADERYVRPELSLPRINFKAQTLARSAAAVKSLPDTHGESRFLREAEARVADEPASWRFVANGKTYSLIAATACVEAALIDASMLEISESTEYFAALNQVRSHTTKTPMVSRRIGGEMRLGFVIDQAALNLVPTGEIEAEQVERAISSVRHFIKGNAERFCPVGSDPDSPTSDIAGWRSGEGEAALWAILPSIWRSEICFGGKCRTTEIGGLRTQAGLESGCRRRSARGRRERPEGVLMGLCPIEPREAAGALLVSSRDNRAAP